MLHYWVQPVTVRIYLIFYISLLEDVKNVNLQDTGRNDIKVKEEEYEAEKILDIRNYKKRIEYLVKWKGYDNTENTWEPAKHLINA